MAYTVADRVKETTVVTGTGPVTLLGAVSGYRTFASQLSIGDTCAYAIVNANASEWEVGIGTYSAANTLTRTTVHASTNSNAAVVFTAGTKDAFLSPTAETVLSDVTSTDGTVTLTKVGPIVDLSVAIAAATENVIVQVRNNTGAILTKGTVVYINNAIGQIPTVAKAIATSDATSAQTLGMISADLANNSNGYVTIIGLIQDINTGAYQDGDQLYLSSTVAGQFTATKQYAPAHLVYVGVVEYAHAVHGKIFVKVQNGYELDELHNVAAQSPSNGQTIVYNSTNQLWEKNTVSLTAGVNGTLPVANGGTGVTTSTGTGSVVLSNTPTLVTPQTNAINAVPVVSGAGNSLTLAAGSGVGTGAGGNLILSPGTQATSGGDGIVILDGLNAGKGKKGDIESAVLGYQALNSLTGVRSANTAIGYQALKAVTSGNQNVGVGRNALLAGTTAYSNVAVGNSAGDILTTSANCVLVGEAAGRSAGDRTTALGIFTLNGAGTQNCVAIGAEAGRNVSGNNNILIGDSAGYFGIPLTTGLNNVLIGYNTNIGVGNSAATNCNVIGNLAVGRGSNTTTVGNSSITNTYIAGSIGPLPLATAAAVTAATGNGTTITYTCANTFSVGQIVSVTGLTTTTGSSLNIANMTIATASSTQFTVTNTTVGTAAATQAGTATIQSAGNNLTLTAGSASGTGAGGSLILQAGLQATSGGDGKVIVKQTTGQTSYLQEWQNSSGSTTALAEANGNLRGRGFFDLSGSYGLDLSTTASANIGLRANTSGGYTVCLTSSSITIPTNALFGFSPSGPATTTVDLSIYRDAADTLAQRRSTNPQAFRVYNTYTDASNYERLGLTWASNVCTIGLAQAGTGATRNLVIAGATATTGAGGDVTISAGNGSGVGAGGNIILQPGAQGTSGGNGQIRINTSAGVDTGFNFTNTYASYPTLEQARLYIRSGSNNNVIEFRADLGSMSSGPANSQFLFGGNNTNYVGIRENGNAGTLGIICGSSSAGGSLNFISSTTAIAANTNDLALSASAFQRISCTTNPYNLTGIAPVTGTGSAHKDGRMIRIYNVGTPNLTLVHNSASSTAANRMFSSTGADIILSKNDYAELIYDATDNGSGAAGWRMS
jgi:hypothetical protein